VSCLLALDDVMSLKLKRTEWGIFTAAPGGSGEGCSGLTRAFFYVGTPSLLVSQWSVNDAATDQLIPTSSPPMTSEPRSRVGVA
jgi:hypothetical protein